MQEAEFQSHRFWSVFAEAESALATFSIEARTDTRFLELQRKFEFIRWVLTNSDPLLISEGELQAARNEISSIAANLSNDAGGFQSFPVIVNSLQAIIDRFQYPRVTKLFKSEATTAVAEVREQARTLSSELVLMMRGTQENLQNLHVEINQGQERLRQLDEELRRVSAEVASKLSSIESQSAADIASKMTEFTNQFLDFQRRSNSEIAARIDSARQSLEDRQQAIDDLAKKIREDSSTFKNAFVAELASAKGEAQRILSEIEGIYNIAGQVALSGGFIEAAAIEANLYEKNALWAKWLFGISASILAIIWFLHITIESTGLQDMFLRLPISLVLLIPAVYFSNLAAKHRKSATTLQSLGLRIKAFDAYIVTAKDTEKQRLRGEMVATFFDTERTGAAQQNVTKPIGDETIKSVTAFFEKVLDRLPGSKTE